MVKDKQIIIVLSWLVNINPVLIKEQEVLIYR